MSRRAINVLKLENIIEETNNGIIESQKVIKLLEETKDQTDLIITTLEVLREDIEIDKEFLQTLEQSKDLFKRPTIQGK